MGLEQAVAGEDSVWRRQPEHSRVEMGTCLVSLPNPPPEEDRAAVVWEGKERRFC